MILDLTPSVASQTHHSMTHAVRCWEAGAEFRIHRGGLVSKRTLPRAIHRVRFWANAQASHPLGEWEATAATPAEWQAAAAEMLAPAPAPRDLSQLIAPPQVSLTF